MFKIAIVEDEVSCVEVLKKHILQYGEEYKITFQIQTFKNAIVFLENYKPEYDIIFMDIKILFKTVFNSAICRASISSSSSSDIPVCGFILPTKSRKTLMPSMLQFFPDPIFSKFGLLTPKYLT